MASEVAGGHLCERKHFVPCDAKERENLYKELKDNLAERVAYLERREKYNSSRVHSIGMTPEKASLIKNKVKVFQNIINNTRLIPKDAKFKVGDKVRISRTKALFEKGYLPNWSEELYIIDQVQKTIPVTYKLKDLLGDEIKGSFYNEELQKSMQEVYRVEKVIRKKKINGVEHALVKWSGYSDKHNSWLLSRSWKN